MNLSEYLLLICAFMASYELHAQELPKATKGYEFDGNYEDIENQNKLKVDSSVSLVKDRAGNSDCAVSFKTKKQHIGAVGIASSNNVDLGLNPHDGFSYSLWYKGGTAMWDDLETILHYGKGISNNELVRDGFSFSLTDDQTPYAEVSGETLNYIWGQQTYEILDTTVWHHAVILVNPTTFKIDIYIDGKKANGGTLKIQIPMDVTFNANLVLGYGFGGALDDVYFYDEILSAEQILKLYNNPPSCGDGNHTSSKEIASFDMHIYPIPTRQYANIKTDIQVYQYTIYSTLGTAVITGHGSGNEQISLHNLTTGVYWIELIDQRTLARTVKVLVIEE